MKQRTPKLSERFDKLWAFSSQNKNISIIFPQIIYTCILIHVNPQLVFNRKFLNGFQKSKCKRAMNVMLLALMTLIMHHRINSVVYCMLQCYVKPQISNWALALVRKWDTTRAKEKSFHLGGIEPMTSRFDHLALPTELWGQMGASHG